MAGRLFSPWGFMFGRLAILGVAGVLLAALIGAGVNASRVRDAHALTNCSTSTMALNASEQQVLTLINTFREQNGVAPLAASPNLSRAAAWMSEDLSSHGTFSHTDSLGRSPFKRVVDCGYGSSGAGENLARTLSAQGAFNLWLGSTAGHRENMLNPRWTVVGIGQAGSIWTTDFGSLNDSAQSWDSAPPPPPLATATPSRTTPATVAVPTATATSPQSSPTPTAVPTSPPGSSVPQNQLPSNLPIKRVTLQMLSSE